MFHVFVAVMRISGTAWGHFTYQAAVLLGRSFHPDKPTIRAMTSVL
jgi:hypothetical protein